MVFVAEHTRGREHVRFFPQHIAVNRIDDDQALLRQERHIGRFDGADVPDRRMTALPGKLVHEHEIEIAVAVGLNELDQ